jgi:ferredoxin-NADP reductase
VREVRKQADGARTVVLDVPGWEGHRAGQSVDVRLTAEDGYRTQRPYSIATAPEEETFELCIEHLDERSGDERSARGSGEVSPWLASELRAGDQFELRGPGGRSFSWHAEEGGPLLLIAGGAGIVPLRAMVRHRLMTGSAVDTSVVVSVRTRAGLLYAEELDQWRAAGVRVHVSFTREGGERLDAAQLRPFGPARHVFVCGPTAFVEHTTRVLLELGHDAAAVRAERFGGASA